MGHILSHPVQSKNLQRFGDAHVRVGVGQPDAACDTSERAICNDIALDQSRRAGQSREWSCFIFRCSPNRIFRVPLCSLCCANLSRTHYDTLPSAEMQGFRTNMEDAHHVCLALPSHPSISYIGMFDGHNGPAAAEFMAREMNKRLVIYLTQRIIDTSPYQVYDQS